MVHQYRYIVALVNIITHPHIIAASCGELHPQRLNFSRTKRFDEFTFDELKHLAARAQLPEKVVLDTAIETIALFHEHWQKEKTNLPLHSNVIEAIDKHIDKVPISSEHSDYRVLSNRWVSYLFL